MSAEHRIRWYAVDPGTREEIPRTRHMNGRDWGWEAVCSCGWRTRTGGAIQERIRDDIYGHRADVKYELVDVETVEKLRRRDLSVVEPDPAPVSDE